MKIGNIKNINFKSQMLNRYITSKASYPETNAQQQNTAPIGTFNQFAYQVNQPCAINTPESNNIQFVINTNSQNNETAIQINLSQAKESKQNPATFKILSKILDNIESEKRAFDNENWNHIAFSNGILSCEAKGKEGNFMGLFNSLTSSILSPDLSEENFNFAKSELIYRMKYNKSYASSQGMDTYPSIEELKKVTLDDVKKLHTDILSNSQIGISLSTSNEFYKENESKIIETLEKTFPKKQIKQC